jgi:hypothetical protein
MGRTYGYQRVRVIIILRKVRTIVSDGQSTSNHKTKERGSNYEIDKKESHLPGDGSSSERAHGAFNGGAVGAGGEPP